MKIDSLHLSGQSTEQLEKFAHGKWKVPLKHAATQYAKIQKALVTLKQHLSTHSLVLAPTVTGKTGIALEASTPTAAPGAATAPATEEDLTHHLRPAKVLESQTVPLDEFLHSDPLLTWPNILPLRSLTLSEVKRTIHHTCLMYHAYALRFCVALSLVLQLGPIFILTALVLVLSMVALHVAIGPELLITLGLRTLWAIPSYWTDYALPRMWAQVQYELGFPPRGPSRVRLFINCLQVL